jgi:hypothetical protein
MKLRRFSIYVVLDRLSFRFFFLIPSHLFLDSFSSLPCLLIPQLLTGTGIINLAAGVLNGPLDNEALGLALCEFFRPGNSELC